jgi:serine/threonine protein kinase
MAEGDPTRSTIIGSKDSAAERAPKSDHKPLDPLTGKGAPSASSINKKPESPQELPVSDQDFASGEASTEAGPMQIPVIDDQQTVIKKDRPEVARQTLTTTQEMGRVLEGELLGHFELLEFVGGGGMGAVFRAHDTQLNRIVAVKVLSREQTDPETLRRFRNEAQSAARLDHENIARVFFVGEDDGWNYIVFEYIEGENIRDLVARRGPLPVAEAINFTIQVAEALEHAYLRDVVHRDVKPSNVLVINNSKAKLVDMGLARLHQVEAPEHDLTASGVTLGTFDYISPEQARDPRGADVRSDLYSLGCTLFFMLTGQAPFPDGTVLQKLLRHTSEPPPDPRTLGVAVPQSVVDICMRLLAKQPAQRYQSPSELIEALSFAATNLGMEQSASGRFSLPAPFHYERVWQSVMPVVLPLVTLFALVFVIELLLREPPSKLEASFPAPQLLAPVPEIRAPQPPSETDTIPTESPSPGVPPKEAEGNVAAPEIDSTGEMPTTSPENEGETATNTEPANTETGTSNTAEPTAETSDDTAPSSTVPGAEDSETGTGRETDDPVLDPGLETESDADMVTPDPPTTDNRAETGTPASGSLPGSLPGSVPGTSAETPAATVEVAPIALTAIVGGNVSEWEYYNSINEAISRCAELAPQDVEIHLRFTGRKPIQPAKISSGKITFIAGSGYQPILVAEWPIDSDESNSALPLLTITGGTLEFHGVHMEVAPPETDLPWSVWQVSPTSKSELARLTTLRSTVTVAKADNAIGGDYLNGSVLEIVSQPGDMDSSSTFPPTIRFDQSLIRSGTKIVGNRNSTPFSLEAVQSFISTPTFLDIEGSKTQNDWDERGEIWLDRVTLLADDGLGKVNRTQVNPYPLALDVRIDHSIILTQDAAPLMEQSGFESMEEAAKWISFSGDQNFYPLTAIRWRITSPGQLSRDFPFRASDGSMGDIPWIDERMPRGKLVWEAEPPAQSPEARLPSDYSLKLHPSNPAKAGTHGCDIQSLPKVSAVTVTTVEE